MRNWRFSITMAAVAGLFWTGCSAPPKSAANPCLPLNQPQTSSSKNNPAAKYLELAGFRMREKDGKIQVTFGVVNHSEADLGDLSLNVDLRTTFSKPGDPPLLSFQAKVSAVGPEQMKEASAIVATKMRIYEMPDWQFVRSDFQVAESK